MKKNSLNIPKWRNLLIVLTLLFSIVLAYSITQSWVSSKKLQSLTGLQQNHYLKNQIQEVEKLFQLDDRKAKLIESCKFTVPAESIHPIRSYIYSDLMSPETNDDFPSCSLLPRTLYDSLKSVEVPNDFILAITSASQDFDSEPFEFISNASAKIIAFEDTQSNFLFNF